jgi:hypothetical protein
MPHNVYFRWLRSILSQLGSNPLHEDQALSTRNNPRRLAMHLLSTPSVCKPCGECDLDPLSTSGHVMTFPLQHQVSKLIVTRLESGLISPSPQLHDSPFPPVVISGLAFLCIQGILNVDASRVRFHRSGHYTRSTCTRVCLSTCRPCCL